MPQNIQQLMQQPQMPQVRTDIQALMNQYKEVRGFASENRDKLSRTQMEEIRNTLTSIKTNINMTKRLPQEYSAPVIDETLHREEKSTLEKLLSPFTYEERKINKHLLAPFLDKVGLIDINVLADKDDIYFDDLLEAMGMEAGFLRTALGMVGGIAESPSTYLTFGLGGALRKGIAVGGQKLAPKGMKLYSQLLDSHTAKLLPNRPANILSTAEGVDKMTKIGNKASKAATDEIQEMVKNGTISPDMFERAGVYAHVPFAKGYKRIPGQDTLKKYMDDVGLTTAWNERFAKVKPIFEGVSRMISTRAFRSAAGARARADIVSDLANSNALPGQWVRKWFTGKDKIPTLSVEQDGLLAQSWERLGQIPGKAWKKDKQSIDQYLEKLRLDDFDEGRAILDDLGMTPEQAKQNFKQLADGYAHWVDLAKSNGMDINDTISHYVAHIYEMGGDVASTKFKGKMFGSLMPGSSAGAERVFPTLDDAISLYETLGINVKANLSATQQLALFGSSVMKGIAYKKFIKTMSEEVGIKTAKTGVWKVAGVPMKGKESAAEAIANRASKAKEMMQFGRPRALRPMSEAHAEATKLGLREWQDPASGAKFLGDRNSVKDIEEFLSINKGRFNSDEMKAIANGWNSFTRKFKKLVTIPFPAFAARNLLSDQSRLLYQHGFRTLDPFLQRDAFRVLTGFDVAGAPKKVGMDKFHITADNGRVISGREIQQNFQKHGLMSYDVQRYDLEQFTKEVLGGKQQWYRPDKFYMRQMGKGNVYVENHTKMVNFLAELKAGRGFQEAADNTKIFAYDYRNVPEAQKAIRVLAPFWNWTYNNTKFMLTRFATHPGQQAAWTRGIEQVGKEGLPQLFGTEKLTDKEKRSLPQFFSENMSIPLYRTATGAGLLSGIDLPIEELNDYGMMEGPVRMLQKVIGTRMHPLLKGVLEFASNTDFFYGTPLEGESIVAGVPSYPVRRGYPAYDLPLIKQMFGTKKVMDKQGKVRYEVNPKAKKFWDLVGAPYSRGVSTAGKISEIIKGTKDKEMSTMESVFQSMPLVTGTKIYPRDLQQDIIRSQKISAAQVNRMLRDARYNYERRIPQ